MKLKMLNDQHSADQQYPHSFPVHSPTPYTSSPVPHSSNSRQKQASSQNRYHCSAKPHSSSPKTPPITSCSSHHWQTHVEIPYLILVQLKVGTASPHRSVMHISAPLKPMIPPIHRWQKKRCMQYRDFRIKWFGKRVFGSRPCIATDSTPPVIGPLQYLIFTRLQCQRRIVFRPLNLVFYLLKFSQK